MDLGISPKRGIWPRDQNQSLKSVVFLSLEENVLKACDKNREGLHLCSFADDTVRAYELFDQAEKLATEESYFKINARRRQLDGIQFLLLEFRRRSVSIPDTGISENIS